MTPHSVRKQEVRYAEQQRDIADATRNRVPGILDKIAEMEEWLADWREGQFSPSYDKHGWPIEMHGLAMDVEWLITVVKADRRER